MKNNIIGNETEEFEEKIIPIKVPMNQNNHNRVQLRNNIDNNINTDASPIDYTDELSKSIIIFHTFKNRFK
jgi:hypothetical protein